MILNFWLSRKASGSQFFSRHRSGGALNAGHLFDSNIRKRPKTTFENKVRETKSCECEHWKVKDDNKRQKSNTFEKQASLEALNTLSPNAFLRKCKLKFGEKQGSGENIFTVKALYL
jgi:hypothetical protein